MTETRMNEPEPLTRIDEYAAAMVARAKQEQATVRGCFNGNELVAAPGAEAEEVANAYRQKMRARSQAALKRRNLADAVLEEVEAKLAAWDGGGEHHGMLSSLMDRARAKVKEGAS